LGAKGDGQLQKRYVKSTPHVNHEQILATIKYITILVMFASNYNRFKSGLAYQSLPWKFIIAILWRGFANSAIMNLRKIRVMLVY
jgi:hypothetical protein